MFISLICNSSSLSSFSDLLRKKKIVLKYMIDEHRGPGEYRTCASSCRHAVLFVFCFLLSEGKSREKCVLYMRNFQKSANVNFSTSVWTCFCWAADLSPTLGNVPSSHRYWTVWCRHIQVTLLAASAGLSGLIGPYSSSVSWCMQSYLCSCTAWTSTPAKREIVEQ